MNNKKKICSICHIEKPLTEFYRQRFGNGKYRPTARCGKCASKSSKEYRIRNKKKVAKTTAKYQRKNRDKVRNWNRNWAKKNPDKMREMWKKYYIQNRDKIILRARKWKRDNAGKANAWARKNRIKNLEKRKNATKKWMQKHPEKAQEYNERRRCKIMNAIGDWTATEWKTLCDRYGNKCLRCHKTNVALTADHVIPLSKGGTNFIWNIQPLCLSCNSTKGIRSDDYRFDHRFDTTIIRAAS